MWVVVGSAPTPAIPSPFTPSNRLSLLKELERPLWVEATAYASAHRLMVPLHAAFAAKDKILIRAFAQHFFIFSKSLETLAPTVLNRVQYLYLASEFLRLASTLRFIDEIPPDLPTLLKNEVLALWAERPAPHWSEAPFQGMGPRISWKLDHKKVAKSYFRAIADDEFYVLAIAADLCVYARVASDPSAWKNTFYPLLATAKRIIEQEGVNQSDGGWLFQPGVWADHPDYLFAGHQLLTPDLSPSPVPGIAWDSSHSHRFPLWLSSLAYGFPGGTPERRRILNIRARLEDQFFKHVVVVGTRAFSGPRTRNFMDGRNGLYRYGYGSLGKNNAYAPFETSTSLLLGWWAFFGTERSKGLYRSLAKSLNDPNCLVLYAGPQFARAAPPKELLDPLSPTISWYRMIASAAEYLPVSKP